MFTERYMVDWLLQNSVGPMWLAMCRKHGWTAEVEARDVDGQSLLDRLDTRRADWRAKREAGEVTLTDLMPLDGDRERRWAYYVPQPIPEDGVAQVPDTLRDFRLLDPAVGSGHFLVVALDLLFALHREEARHRGLVDDPDWSDAAIVARILRENLHGIDLDPRAVQIAAAALWLKARRLVPGAALEQMNLVASNLRLGSLPDDDPALVELQVEVERETGLPGTLTATIVHALRGADHLGSLLKVDRAVDEAIETHEEAIKVHAAPQQGELYQRTPPRQTAMVFDAGTAKRSVVDRLEAFLARHTAADDLGLRLRGEQLAAGVRFVRLVREARYHLVVANPPYQGTSKMADATYVEQRYPLGKADLYAAFLLRGLELVRPGGVSAMLTMRNWMFIKQYTALREHLLSSYDLRALHDVASGAFEEIQAAQVVVSVAASVFRKGVQKGTAVALRAFDDATLLQTGETPRKRAATLCQVRRHEFAPAALKVVGEWPVVYWWSQDLLREDAGAPKVGERWLIRKGLTTCNNVRFIRRVWEIARDDVCAVPCAAGCDDGTLRRLFYGSKWVPWIDGGESRQWRHELESVLLWSMRGLQIAVAPVNRYGRGEEVYFRAGIAFTMIGSTFKARAHVYRSIIGNMGASIYGDRLVLLCQIDELPRKCASDHF